jgi:hypothetical protein
MFQSANWNERQLILASRLGTIFENGNNIFITFG